MEKQVLLYTKPGCCLCDRVREQLRALARKRPFSWSEVNILEDETARARFAADIPVIFVNGRKAFEHRLDEDELLALLERIEQPEQGRGGAT